MEPCLFRHGKEMCRKQSVPQAHLLQWSHVFSDMVRGLSWMEQIGAFGLQWSHVFSDMVRLLILMVV